MKQAALRTATVRLRFRFAQATPDTLHPDGLSVAAPRVARQGEAWWGKKDSNLRSRKKAEFTVLFRQFRQPLGPHGCVLTSDGDLFINRQIRHRTYFRYARPRGSVWLS